MIDWARVSELREELGADDFSEIVALFLGEVDEVIARLSGSPDQSTLAEDLHFLRGSAMNLGFADLAMRCAEGEKTAADGDVGSVDIALVVQTYDLSKSAFLVG